MPDTIEKAAWETDELYKFLFSVPVGQVITYQEMNDIIHRSVQKDRHFLYTALRRLQNSDKRMFQTVRGVGIVRTASQDVVIQERLILPKRIARMTSRKLRRLEAASADMESFRENAKRTLMEEWTYTRTIRAFTRTKTIERVNVIATSTNPNASAQKILKSLVENWPKRK